MDASLQSYASLLRRFSDIPDSEWRWFASRLRACKLNKSDYFIRSGERADSIGFCAKGLFRFYYSTEDGDELNKSFCGEGDFVASFHSLLLDSPSLLHVQALEDSALWVISYEDYTSLYDRHVCWERLGRKVSERLFVKKEQRERELLLCSAEERYRLFVKEHPELHERIPQYHIASYLGITPVALSRIRRRINLG